MTESQATQSHFIYAIPYILSVFSLFAQMPYFGKDNVYHIPGYILFIVFIISVFSPFFLVFSREATCLETIDYIVYKYDYDAKLLKDQLDRYKFNYFPVEDFECYMAKEKENDPLSQYDAKKYIERYIEDLHRDYDIIAKHENQYWDRTRLFKELRYRNAHTSTMRYNRVQELREIKDRKMTSNTAIL